MTTIEEDLAYAQADARHWHQAWERTDEQLRLAIRREAHKSGLIDAARELVPLVRYHAMHAGVSPQDRARIAALCDEIEERPRRSCGGHHPYCACYLPVSTAFVDYSTREPEPPACRVAECPHQAASCPITDH